jgi:voltage-gated sodium channel
MKNFERVLLSKGLHGFIIILVLLNGLLLGVQTKPEIVKIYGDLIYRLDFMIICLLGAEIILRLVIMRSRFFKRGWNIFDAVVVGASIIGFYLSDPVIHSLRVLLLFRIVEFSAPMRLLIRALIMAFPGILNSIIILCVVFYTFGLIGVYTYGTSSPEHFAHINVALLSLFQIMVFDNFGDITWTLVEKSPQSWIFIIAFLFFTAFSFFNLLVGVVVNAIDAASSKALKLEEKHHRNHVRDEIKAVKDYIIRILKHHNIKE